MERYAHGLKNISKRFLALTNKVLSGAGVYSKTHQDDIIITSESFMSISLTYVMFWSG